MEHRQDSIRRKILHFSNRTVDVVLDRVVPGAPNAEDWMFDEEVRLGHTHRNDAIDDAASKHSSSKRSTAHRGFESEAEGEGSKDGSRSNGSSRDRKRKRSRAPFSPSKVPELRVPPLYEVETFLAGISMAKVTPAAKGKAKAKSPKAKSPKGKGKKRGRPPPSGGEGVEDEEAAAAAAAGTASTRTPRFSGPRASSRTSS
mmetsp:Transcript_96866/g.276935  ORF Transcript_96866/g.276935 Transcript_96866/m.276935 type:complete len:201 (+) Transcript_96866:431-1033(+)